MTEIAQAYFHLSPFSVGRGSLPRHGELAEQAARNAGLSWLRTDCYITVELESGSLRGWVTAKTVAAGLFAAYQTIAEYDNFKVCIGHMCKILNLSRLW